MWHRRGTCESALLGAALGLAAPSQAATPSPTDIQAVTQAFEQRGTLLTAACGAGAGDELNAAAVQLGDANGGVALAAAVTNAVRTIERVDAAADTCAAAPPHLPEGPVQFMRDPARIAGAADRIRAWGEDEASGAWTRIAAAGEPNPNVAYTDVCRCFGEAVRGVRVVYGYPTPEMTAWLRSYELLGELHHGGCELGPPLACPDGCWPDRQRLGDPPFPPRDIAWHVLGGLQVGVAGARTAETSPRRTRANASAKAEALAEDKRRTAGATTPPRARATASVKAEASAEEQRTAEATTPRRARARASVEAEAFAWKPDPSDAEALGACLGEHKLGRARRGDDGVWAAWYDNDRDTCVATWATAHLTDTRIDRLAVIRAE